MVLLAIFTLEISYSIDFIEFSWHSAVEYKLNITFIIDINIYLSFSM